MRTAFIQQLVQEARANDKIFLLVGDLGFHVIEPFAEAFSDRFCNVGISEQNMAGMAAGLALDGYNVYIYSIGNFPTLRCLEQTRNDICYYNANVKIVSVGAGYAYGTLGYSHHTTEDIGVMRSLPNMLVASPSDPSEAKAVTRFSANYNGTMYIRLGKAGEQQVFPDSDFELKPGDLHCLRESKTQNVLLVSGSIMRGAVDWLDESNVDTAVYSVPFIKPLNRIQLADIAARHPNMVVLDEHQKSCGLASALLEQISDTYTEGILRTFPHVKRVEIKDCFEHLSGNQVYLRKRNGLELNTDFFK